LCPKEITRQSLFVCNSCFTDDGLIDESDLREVMKACMVENGMEYDESEVSVLANALFEDAVQVCVQIFLFNFKYKIFCEKCSISNI
jgi:hypothetical protein